MDAKWMVAGVVGLGVAMGWPAAAPAWAQQIGVREGAPADEDDEMLKEMMVLSIPRESAGFYADIMGLDGLQREVALEMHRDYLAKYRDAAVAMRDFMRGFQEKMQEEGYDFENMETDMAEMARVAVGFMDRVLALGDDYVADLGALAAGEDQEAGHQRVVRTRNREMASAMGTMNGGTEGSAMIDLIALGRRLDPPLLPAEDGAAQQALLEYEREMGDMCGPFVDRALEAFRAMAKAMGEGREDPELEGKMEAEMEAMSERFAATNERTLRRVHNALPPERQAAWDLAYKRARWPQVYAPGDFHRLHDAALALEGLTGDQRAAVDAAMAQYVREAEPANKKWIDALAEQDQAMGELGDEWDQEKWEAYQAKQQAVTEAQSDRQALDDRFGERVMKTLTPEQRAAMPTNTSGAVDADEVIRQMGGG